MQLAGVPDLEGVLQVVLAAAADAVGGRRAAVLQRDRMDRLRVIGDLDAGLPSAMAVGDVRSVMWAVVMGRTDVTWGADDGAPSPLDGIPGWEQGLLVSLDSESAAPKVLAVATGTAPSAEQVAQVEALSRMALPAIRHQELVAASARTQTLLQRVTRLAAELTRAQDPSELMEALSEGLAAIDGIDGAAVWRRTDGEGPRVEAGVPKGVDTLLDDTGRRRLTAILDPAVSEAMRSMLAASEPLEDDRLLTLLPIPLSPDRVLGLIHPEPLDPEARDVFGTLVGAIGPALRQAELTVDRRSLVAAFNRELRPSRIPDGLDVAVQYHPNTTAADTFGGDFYDWFATAAGRIVVALGDVSGKGIPAAAAASMAVWSLRALGRQGTGPATLARLLDVAVDHELPDDRFVTLALAEVDPVTAAVKLVLAGHPAPLVIADGEVRELQLLPDRSVDRPLGVWPEGPAFQTHEVRLGEGEVLLLFTDGVIEAKAPDGRRLGRSVLTAAIQDAPAAKTATPDRIAALVWTVVRDWVGGTPDDDCAIVAVRRV